MHRWDRQTPDRQAYFGLTISELQEQVRALQADVSELEQGVATGAGQPGPPGPPGPPGSGALTVWGETPSGNIDGVNRNYATAKSYTAGLLAVYLNGIRQRRPGDYVETGQQSFQFVNAPLPGDSLSIDYIQP
jgi:hypothetical protein